MSSTTPNMLLVIPDPGVTPGPAWSSELNTALERVDGHDHSASNGVKITPSGLNINTDLSLDSHSLIDVTTVVLDSQLSDPSTGTTIFVKNGELFYLDDGANSVQITNNGSVAGATGTISGMGGTDASAAYSDFNKDFTFNHDSGRPAKFNISDIALYPFTQDPATPASDFVSLKSPAALASQYNWVFPLAVPTKKSPLVWDGTGVVDDIELADGQILIGSTAGAVTAATLTATANQTTVINGANSITVGTVQDIGATSSPTFATPTLTSALIGNGSEATPAIRFTSDPDLGIFRNGTNQLGLAAAQVLSGGNGAAATPSYSFVDDPDTGVYRAASNNIGFSTGGTEKMVIGASTITMALPLNIDGGGAFKVSVLTGTINVNNLDIINGVTVYGAFGVCERGFTWQPVYQEFSNAHASGLYFSFGASGTEVQLNRMNTDSYTYRVVVFHA